MAKLVIYSSNQCGACKRLVPTIKRNAKALGDKVTVKDIDKCKTEDCDRVSMTPTLVRDGHELSEAELKPYLRGAGR